MVPYNCDDKGPFFSLRSTYPSWRRLPSG